MRCILQQKGFFYWVMQKAQELISKRLKELNTEEEFPKYVEEKSTKEENSKEEITIKKKESEEIWEIREIPVQVKPAVFNKVNNEYFIAEDLETAKFWARVLNNSDKLEKAILG